MIQVSLKDEAFEELQILEKMPGVSANISYFLQFYQQLDRIDLASSLVAKIASDDALTIEANKRTEAENEMNSLFIRIENGLPVSHGQYNALIKSARRLGYQFERGAIILALGANPDDDVFQSLARRDEFAMKFFSPAIRKASSKPGWLAKSGIRPRRGSSRIR